ncbi:transposase [Pseudovibrio sp. Tun.PSC04-5.I4]|uniref:transposase n=1 Tax=Pseudovibrio sp. Tun.PSC04-5.I4 TaxID=1798213 RepID=UPI00117A9A1B|nr:transposase [Pseudovibrio sp. Tun.PSC04-5.I4]
MLDESRPRRSWTRVEKAAITAQVGVDGATLFDVAQSHGVGRYLLTRWMPPVSGMLSAVLFFSILRWAG